MKYLEKSFSVVMGGRQYGDGWERTFASSCPQCGATMRRMTHRDDEVEPPDPDTWECDDCGHWDYA